MCTNKSSCQAIFAGRFSNSFRSSKTECLVEYFLLFLLLLFQYPEGFLEAQARKEAEKANANGKEKGKGKGKRKRDKSEVRIHVLVCSEEHRDEESRTSSSFPIFLPEFTDAGSDPSSPPAKKKSSAAKPSQSPEKMKTAFSLPEEKLKLINADEVNKKMWQELIQAADNYTVSTESCRSL